MNKSFKSIWCEKTGTYVAAAEVSRSRGKKSSSSVVAAAVAVVAGLAGLAVPQMALADLAQDEAINAHYIKISGSADGTDDASAVGNDSVAIGPSAIASGRSAVALGSEAHAGGYATALGAMASAADLGTAIGLKANSTGEFSIAIGGYANSAGMNSIALGPLANSAGDFSTALGASASSAGYASIALGVDSSALEESSVALGADSIADRGNAVSVGNETFQRQIMNVAAGTADTDAVIVSQLKGVTDALGGGAGVGIDGSVTGPSYVVGGRTVDNVGDAFADIDGRVSNVEGSVTNLAQQLDGGGIGLVKQDATTKNITVAKDTGGMSVDFTGTEGARVLGGVAAGKLAVDSQEAVNGSQLFATNQNVQANTTNIATNTANIANNTTNIATIDGRVNNVEGSVTNLTQQLDGGSVGLVQQDATSGDITVAKNAGGMSVDFTGTEGARVLGGVAAGKLAVDSQEAVNGSQLFATNQNVQTNATNIATNTANIANNMTAIANMGGRFSSVEDSLSSLSEQFEATHLPVIEKIDSTVQASNAHVATAGDSSQAAVASGDNAVAMGAGATASANNSVALGADSKTGNRENIVSVGSAGNERAIANVADAVMDTDAVNKRQLDAVSASSQAYTDERINQVQSDIASVKRDANGAAAAAMAVATLPQSIIPGRGMASAAVSNMDGESAVAVGISKVSENSRWVTKLAGTVNTRGKVGVSAGIGFHW